MTMGNVISENRKKLELTQEALAQKLGVTNQAVSKWETDQSLPDTMLLPALAEALGISIDALFGRESVETALTLSNTKNTVEVPWEDDDALHAVLFKGHTLIGNNDAKENICFRYEGPALIIFSDFSVECEEVTGDIHAGTYVECGNVGGNINTGTYVECSDVEGDIRAGTYVECNDVKGTVNAGAYVECGQVGGTVGAGTYVECNDVGGDVKAGGYVECGTVGGSVSGSSYGAGGKAGKAFAQIGKKISDKVNREIQKNLGKEFDDGINSFLGGLFDDIADEKEE